MGKYRHEKKCISENTESNNSNNSNNCVKNDNTDQLNNRLDIYEKIIEKLISSNTEISKTSIAKTADVATKSMSVLKYASTHMADAPAMKELEKEEIYGILNYEGNDSELNDEDREEKNDLYVRTIIGHYINKNLVGLLGDMIVLHFRKPNEDVQKNSSIWAVDVARLSFIIMHAINKDGEKEWKNDKTGKSFNAMVIQPMLRTLGEILKKYIEYKQTWAQRNKNASIEEMGRIMNVRQGCAELLKDINYRHFEKPLIKYVAPSFKFDDYLKKK
jgi:hypothetical protein